MSDSREGVGIVVTGADEDRKFYYYVAAGLNPEHHVLHFLSATGSGDDTDFQHLDPVTNPSLFRETIIDAKFEHTTKKKEFYNSTVQNDFNRVLTENFDRIHEIRNSSDPETELESLLSSELRKFRPRELNASFVELDQLELDGETEEDPDEEEEENPSNAFDHDLGEDVTVRTVQPIIDVENGRSVRSLEPGDTVFVKSPRSEDDEAHSKAVFLEFSTTGSDGEGAMLVRLDEDVRGQASVSSGSLLKVQPDSREDDALSSFLVYVGYLLLFLFAVMLFLVLR